MDCPPATQDLAINTKNRDATIKKYNYGPLNVDEPGDYWKDIAKYWKTTETAAKKSVCANCVAFDISPRMKECLPGDTFDDDGELGYCWMHHFKCHSARACHTWAKGGPIKVDKESHEWQERAFGKKEGLREEPRIPRKKGQPAGSDKHSDLYTDEDPEGTIHGLGFKDVETAKASVKKIESSDRTHAHKIQAAIAMEQRARVMGKTAEAAVYRAYIEKMKKKTKEMQKEDAEDDRLQKTIKVATAKTNIAKRIKNMKVQQKAALKNIKDKDRKKARSDDMKKKMQRARDDGKREIKQIQRTFEAQKEDIDITGLRTQLVKKMFSKQKHDVYHSNFPSVIQHIADMAKKLYGITIDPQTVTDTTKNKNKPKAGVTKRFSLKGDKGSIKAFVYNRGGLENPFELRMYQEDLEMNEDVRKMPGGGYGVYADVFKDGKRVMTPGGKHKKELKKVYDNKNDANDYMAAIMIAKGGG
tara:strand:- start:564 stop:1979 length:1416 start_codon:yes stop_codon:yes gene_type:complete